VAGELPGPGWSGSRGKSARAEPIYFPSALQNDEIWAASILIGIEPTAVQNGGSGASPANHATLEQPRLEAQAGADLGHMVTGGQVQALDHPGRHRRLRGHLPVPDRDGLVAVGSRDVIAGAEPVKAVCDRRATAPVERPGGRTREDGLD
jgi:hypothetical protein